MKNISKKIVETIKDQKIKPKPKWKISSKKYFYWTIIVSMVTLAGLFTSLAILNLVDFDMRMFRHFHLGRYLRLLILAAPYLWIILTVVCFFLGILFFKKTKTGYRYSLLFVASTILFASSVIGVMAHFSNVNHMMDEAMRGREFGEGSDFRRLIPQKGRHLLMPEEGVLVGEIIEATEKKLTLVDPLGTEWLVEFSKEIWIEEKVELESGEKVLIFGKKKAANEFKAVKIRSIKKLKQVFKDKGMKGELGGRIGCDERGFCAKEPNRR